MHPHEIAPYVGEALNLTNPQNRPLQKQISQVLPSNHYPQDNNLAKNILIVEFLIKNLLLYNDKGESLNLTASSLKLLTCFL